MDVDKWKFKKTAAVLLPRSTTANKNSLSDFWFVIWSIYLSRLRQNIWRILLPDSNYWLHNMWKSFQQLMSVTSLALYCFTWWIENNFDQWALIDSYFLFPVTIAQGAKKTQKIRYSCCCYRAGFPWGKLNISEKKTAEHGLVCKNVEVKSITVQICLDVI